VGGEEARTWKPVRSETKLSGAAASARRSRGWEGGVSTARERARARRRRRAHALVKSARRCTVLELAGTRAERRRGGVRARARARKKRDASRQEGFRRTRAQRVRRLTHEREVGVCDEGEGLGRNNR
jgi:hypothetical protein